jgi:HEAT repeat protein
LIAALDHDHWRVREQAAYVLGAVASEDALPALMKILADREWQVRFAGLHALRGFGAECEARGARLMVDDPDRRVRSLAARLKPSRST